LKNSNFKVEKEAKRAKKIGDNGIGKFMLREISQIKHKEIKQKI